MGMRLIDGSTGVAGARIQLVHQDGHKDGECAHAQGGGRGEVEQVLTAKALQIKYMEI